MAKADIQVYSTGGRISLPIKTFQVISGGTAINAGEFCVLTTIGTNQYVNVITDALPIIGTDYVAGLAAAAGTQTSSAAGKVDLYLPHPGVVFRGKAKSSTAADTQAKVDALNFKRTIIDVTTGTHTVDTAASDGSTNGFMIVGGDPNGSFIDFVVSVRATILGF